jgi:hypothetical protein
MLCLKIKRKGTEDQKEKSKELKYSVLFYLECASVQAKKQLGVSKIVSSSTPSSALHTLTSGLKLGSVPQLQVKSGHHNDA